MGARKGRGVKQWEEWRQAAVEGSRWIGIECVNMRMARQ